MTTACVVATLATDAHDRVRLWELAIVVEQFPSSNAVEAVETEVALGRQADGHAVLATVADDGAAASATFPWLFRIRVQELRSGAVSGCGS